MKPEVRRALIIEAAQSLLLSQGFSALTLRNTAEAAEIRMATLQYYFPSREALFKQAFQDIVDNAWNDVMDKIDRIDSSEPEARLRCYVKSMCDASRNGPLVGCFIELWAAARVHDYAADIMRVYYDDAVVELAKLLKAVNSSTTTKQSQQQAVLTMSMIEGLALFNQIDSKAKRRSRVPIDRAVESIMSYLAWGEEMGFA
ncbi:MAG: TetR/AcrR family transcriptional regulator [Pseudomonadales bacterium]